MNADVAALVVAVASLVTSSGAAFLALRVARHANSNPVLIDLFTEHRSPELAAARVWVHAHMNEFPQCLDLGLDGLPADVRDAVRDLAWFYDNLGVLVHHGVVDIEPVSGYLGGSVLDLWPKYSKLVAGERARRERAGSEDPRRWQFYFESLYEAVRACPPETARKTATQRRLSPWRSNAKV